jgi:hypothetical protein
MRFLLFLLFSTSLSAATCDCEVRVYHPTTASQKIKSAVMMDFKLETFDSYSVKNQRHCRALCLKKFREDLPSSRLSALLQTLSQRLIEEGVVGYNCTGLTTFRYPLRVKAYLGRMSLGNVEDRMEVVTHEEACF